MTYKFIIRSAATFLLLSPLFVIGIDPTTSGRIINAFKEEEYKMIFESAPFDMESATEVYKKEYILGGLEALKKRLEESTNAYKEKKDLITEKRMTLEDAIAGIENAITDTLADITKTERSMQEKNSRIEEYEDLSLELSSRIKKNRAVILEYLSNIYSEGSLIFNDTSNIDIFQTLIMTGDDIDTVSKNITYKSLVSVLGQKFIEEYRGLLKDYSLIELRIREELALLEADTIILEKQKSNLLSQRDYREKLLETTKGQEALFTLYMDSQIQIQKQVEESWHNAAEDYMLSLDQLLEENGCKKEKKTGEDVEKCGNILAFYRNERALKKIEIATGTTNILDWPVREPDIISAFFRENAYYQSIGAHHDAIDIPVSQGSEVLASMDGYVSYILAPTPEGYSYLALKHPDGYVTVYGHLSQVLVYPYQFVRKGEKIAESGGMPGTPGAGPMTTGPHLHFEVWKDRETVDPLRFLDISLLEYAMIPSRYQDKFITDLISRFGTGVDTSAYERKFMIRGETESDRQKYLLRTYATRDFQNHDLWVDTALDARIDPSFLMCVGLAETTLGNFLKTPYNIGNVGNTDSGDTTSFSSPQEGIAWMASTFNNRYLSHYNYVSELSRWGNPDGTIYASSNTNWHNNIIRCVSSLKGRFVEDAYPFRIQRESSEKIFSKE